MHLLDELKQRGLVKDVIHEDELTQKLSSEKCTAYIGFDLTAKSLHIGNLVQLMILRKFLQYGHKVIVILGGGTTKIGDPSDKNEMRKMLAVEDIESNKRSISTSVVKLLNNKDNLTILDNDEWLKDLKYIDFLRDIGRHFTINKMVNMEFVKRRLESETPITFLEFNYMLIQGYDFLYLNQNYGCNIQIGGSDQWGNILQGVELIRKHNDKDAFGFTVPLITKSDGQKMGKSANGAIWLNADMCSPYEYYQYFRNVDDADVLKMLKIFTDLSLSEIENYKDLKSEELNPLKEKLAFLVTEICHGTDAANDALSKSRGIFSGSLDQVDISVEHECNIIDVLISNKICESKGEARRLLEQSGIKIDQITIDANYVFNETGKKVIMSVGKKRRFVIEVI